MKSLLLRTLIALSLLIACGASGGTVRAQQKHSRVVSGRVYFTNNTPADRASFPIELLSADGKRVISRTTQGEGEFSINDIKPGKYLLRFTGPSRCTLTYRADLSKVSRRDIRILMDVQCAHTDGSIKDLPTK
jgi:hypothetical protein